MKHFTKIGTLFLALTLAALLMPSQTVQAAETDKPFKQFHTIVDAAFVKDIVDGKTIGLLIDSRPKKMKYDMGHIPGAINIPDSQFDKMVGLLPADKGALIVFYCQGLKCPLSHKGAFAAEKLGYTNVKVYAKGYPDFKKTYAAGCGDPDLVASGGQVLVIDGEKAKKVLELIEQAGLGTAEASGPKQTGLYKPGRSEGSIDFAVFKDLVKAKPESVILVDNREPDEFAAGSLPTAQNIPVDKLETMLAEWKVDKPLIFFCGTGARSGEAYYMVKDMRPDIKEVYFVDGEFTFDDKGEFKIDPPK